MIHLLKKLYLHILSLFKKKESLEISEIRKQLQQVQQDQVVLLEFCKENFFKKKNNNDIMSKNIINHDKQLNELNKLINQHADIINSFLESYKKHVIDPSAHYSNEENFPVKKKKRTDN